MPFVHTDKKAGDLIRSADWNAMGTEVVRLGADKISRAGEESLEGPLTVRGALTVGAGSGGGLAVRGDLAVGTPNAGATVRVLKKQEDGRDPAHGAVVLGTDSATSAGLRMGYFGTYSWLQGQGQQTLALNPHGGNVGIGTAAPGATLQVSGDTYITGTLRFGSAVRQMLNLWGTGYGLGVQASTVYLRTDGGFAFYRGGSHNDAALNPGGGAVLLSVLSSARLGVATGVAGSTLSVNGNAAVGAAYAASAAPANGLIVQGNLGAGTTAPVAPLQVNGDLVLNEKAGQRFIAHTRLNSSGDFLQLTVDDAAGNWEWGKGITLRRATGNVGIGTTDPQARLHVSGDALVGGTLGFGKAVRQMVNLWGTAYGIGVQSYTTYLRTDGNFAIYKGGSHNDGQLNPGGGTPLATVSSDGTLTAGAFRFGGSLLTPDQGGSLELGGHNEVAGTGTPYIDFHYAGKKQDYNTRIINDADGQLSVSAARFAVRDCFAVSLACADFLIGHPSRRKTPGRALVDETTVLTLNYGGDWSGGVRYWGALTKASTRDIKEDICLLDEPEAASLLRGLEPVRYRLTGDRTRAEHMGFVAEDVPDAIASPDHRSINESHVVAVLTRVVKEQQRRLDELAHRLEQGLSHG